MFNTNGLLTFLIEFENRGFANGNHSQCIWRERGNEPGRRFEEPLFGREALTVPPVNEVNLP